MPSIEILIEKPSEELLLDSDLYPFALKVSRPPLSDRSPSLWQEQFTRIGGALVHIGEARFKLEASGWFFAYDLLDEEKCSRFRFKPQYKNEIEGLLAHLLAHSGSKTINFTSDWQFGPKPAKVYPKAVTLREFIRRHDASGLRFNSWLPICGTT